MCGIAGILQLNGAPASAAQMHDMVEVLAHRGPDGEGVLELGPLVLGHRRLAIIDLSERGAQPMHLADAGLTIVHNGEVYNYLELRTELEQAGVEFRSDTDTEVVLRAYERWGLEAFGRFNGMWGLAIWDARAQRLVLSRDRFGIKPLYLYQDGERLLFASEVKAILRAAPAAREVDTGVLGRFLEDGVQDDGPRTFYARVQQLRPGCTLTIDPAGRREEHVYWEFSAERSRQDYDYSDPAGTLRGLLDDAVGLRLRSDVPVGTCLSGGLDSSSVVALAAGHSSHPVRTFTAVYDDRGYDEREFARTVVERFGCQAHEVSPNPGPSLVPLLDRIGWFHDEPCSRPGLITQWHVMESAQGQVKVLLDGQGGDELLLGYAYYALPYLRTLGRAALRSPLSWDLRLKLWRDGRGLLRQPSTSSGGTGSLARHLVRAGLQRLRPRKRRAGLDPALLAAAAEVRAQHGPPAQAPGTTPIDRVLREDLSHRSMPALLHHEDRTSMAFSIEARVPFLDHRVVEFSLGLDYRQKVEGGLMKSVLRKAMRADLPPSITERKDKLGYPTPIARWLRESAADAKDLLLYDFADRGYVPTTTVEQAWNDFERGHGDPWRLYRWLTTELWLSRCVDRPPVTRAPALPS